MSDAHEDLVPMRRGLRDQVYEAVLDLVLRGAFPAGGRLPIDGLAARLKVSPTPVREALAHMERTGLVTREGYKGYRVAEPLTIEQMRELLDARELLEVQAAHWAARAMPDFLDALRRAHAAHVNAARQVEAELRSGSPEMISFRAYFAADEAFHHVIFLAAGNRFLQQMITSLGTHMHRLRQSVIHRNYDMADALAEHAAVLAAAESGDEEGMVSAMHAHLQGIRERSLHLGEQVGESGAGRPD